MLRTFRTILPTAARFAWLVAFLVAAVNAWHVAAWIYDPATYAYVDVATILHIAASAIALGVTLAKVMRPPVPYYVSVAHEDAQ